MIITRTPFRLSFAGGGTDLADFYRLKTGAVVSTAIDKYMYIVVNRRFDDSIRVSYSRTEIVNSVDELRHPIARECLKLVGITRGIEIVSIADIPAGAGLGSSGSFTVGLLNALYAYRGVLKSAEDLAQEACRIEIEIIGEPVGKQDQYIAAYGGFRHIQFNADDTVFTEPIIWSKKNRAELNRNLLLLYTGDKRPASHILKEQKENTRQADSMACLEKMRDMALDLRERLNNKAAPDILGETMHRGWVLKKQLASRISNTRLDGYYEKALGAGALGGKVSGAGGGGFLLLYCPGDRRAAVKEALGLKEQSFSFEPEGSKIIYVV
ncbi:MAG: GHMP kinase [Chloroflexi bacterium]|nr:GHMP kinase [Chloroflexota bacterium]